MTIEYHLNPMAASRKGGKQATPPPDLEVTVLESVRAAPGVTVAALKKHVPVSHKKFVTDAFIKSLAERGEIFFIKKGKRTFPTDPFAEIDAKLPDDAAREPIEKDAFKELVRQAARGYEAVFDEWLKRALAEGKFFEHASAKPKGRKKRFGREPDIGSSLQPPPDLDVAVLESVRAAPGVTVAALRKHVPVGHRKFVTEALIKSLADRGEIFLVRKGRSNTVFQKDPFAEIDARLPDDAAREPIEKDAFKELVRQAARGYEAVFDEWLKRALAEGKFFEHASAKPKGRKKRFGREPDISSSLKPALKALAAALAELDAQRVPRERVAEALLSALGLRGETTFADENGTPKAAASNHKVSTNGRGQFLSALEALANDNPRDALLSVRALRSRAELGKQEFDTIALELSREGVVSLHHHDHATALPDAERTQLIQDARGTYFNGIAPRRGHD